MRDFVVVEFSQIQIKLKCKSNTFILHYAFRSAIDIDVQHRFFTFLNIDKL